MFCIKKFAYFLLFKDNSLRTFFIFFFSSTGTKNIIMNNKQYGMTLNRQCMFEI